MEDGTARQHQWDGLIKPALLLLLNENVNLPPQNCVHSTIRNRTCLWPTTPIGKIAKVRYKVASAAILVSHIILNTASHKILQKAYYLDLLNVCHIRNFSIR